MCRMVMAMACAALIVEVGPVEAATVVFTDDFEDGTLDKWSTFGDTVVMNGHLFTHSVSPIDQEAGRYDGAIVKDLVLSDFRLNYRMNILVNSGTTETFIRMSEPTEGLPDMGYMLSFRSDLKTVQLNRTTGSSENRPYWEILQKATFTHSLNTWYDIQIQALDDSLRVWINDALVVDVVDSSVQSGSIRLASWTQSKFGWTDEQVLWDDVVITDLSTSTVPEPSTAALWAGLAILGLPLSRWQRRWGSHTAVIR